MSTPPTNSFGTVEPAPDASEPLTEARLNEILVAFKASVERDLARQKSDLVDRFGGDGRFPDFESGTLAPGSDPNDADQFSVVPDQSVSTAETNRYSGQRLVKSTVNIPADLHAKLKRYGIEQGVGAGLSLQTQLTIAIEEYLAKRGL